ncbi:transcription elongation factor GreAB [Shewanella youngdeokensis]|uniref:Transcription elongation factor GreAB n=1 Tax=Shewanella youngdeokensis TaxID=2999068 RepID=A0ABZ0JTU9_9GAMM|nr:transcription elongation factor GreAB [Shewanella sp. DAU334]
MLSRTIIEQSITQALASAHQSAVDAAKRAHDTATGTDSVAENKYDTFGLEASYLAHGQSVRVAECKADIHNYQQMFALYNQRAALSSQKTSAANGTKHIGLGDFIELIDDQDKVTRLFIGPSAGGLKVAIEQGSFMLITPQSPLGQQIFNCELDAEIVLTIAGVVHRYEISAIG